MREATQKKSADGVLGDCGFTLMEVLVALAILSLSLGVLLAVFSQSLDRVHRNQLDLRARLLAQSLLEEIGSVKLGQTHGQTADGLTWTLDVKPFGTSADRNSWRPLPVKVTADVEWHKGDVRHTLELSTLRLMAGQP